MLGENLSTINNRKIANDIFITPKHIVDKCIEFAKIQPSDVVLDPCCGLTTRPFIDVLNSIEDITVEFNEILLGDDKDFFVNNDVGRYDIIIGNPPFSLYKKWIDHTIHLKPNRFVYCYGLLNITQRRFKYINDRGYFIDNIAIMYTRGWFSSTCIVVSFSSQITKNCIDI